MASIRTGPSSNTFKSKSFVVGIAVYQQHGNKYPWQPRALPGPRTEVRLTAGGSVSAKLLGHQKRGHALTQSDPPYSFPRGVYFPVTDALTDLLEKADALMWSISRGGGGGNVIRGLVPPDGRSGALA